MILLIDNYDSFAHNLARYLRQLQQDVVVIRNDEWSLDQIRECSPQAIVMSPGPCRPDQAGICLDVVSNFKSTIPMLGVCLGHQVICQSLGGSVIPVRPVHGRGTAVIHHGHALFQGIDSQFIAGRYHSLVADQASIPNQLEVIARTEDNAVMAVAHRERPIIGVQFHPESILTDCGYRLLGNFLHLARLSVDTKLIGQLTEQLRSQTRPDTVRRPISRALTPHPWQESSNP